MKKIVLIMLLVFSSFTYADEGRYSIVSDNRPGGGVWILDTKDGSIKFCRASGNNEIVCSKPNNEKN
jgi:hypothetical protein